MSFSRILVCLDGSELAEHGLRLADVVRPDDGTLTLLRVAEDGEAAKEAASYLEPIAAAREGKATPLVRESDDPDDCIVDEAGKGHDLAVAVTHGHTGFRALAWGSTTEHLVRHCPIPVLIGNPQQEGQSTGKASKILVPLDGSEVAQSILELVQPLSKALDAEIVLFTAIWVEPNPNAQAFTREIDERTKQVEEGLKAKVAELTSAGIKASSDVGVGYPESEILEAVTKSGADLIAMSTHGRTGVKRWLLGSVAERVLHSSPVPVLLKRAQAT